MSWMKKIHDEWDVDYMKMHDEWDVDYMKMHDELEEGLWAH